MPAYDTPGPISAAIELPLGDVEINASDRADTVVDVRPSDPSHEPDVRAAEQTRVEFTDGSLLVRAPKQRGLSVVGRGGSVDVIIGLPSGSDVRGEAAAARFRCEGRLGECRLKTAAGDIKVGQAGALELTSSSGGIVAEQVTGDAEISTGSGRVRLREVGGSAVIKNSNGETWVGEIGGDLRVNAANGTISVDHAGGGVSARTSNGDIRVGEVTRGSATLKTSFGEIEIGLRSGTAALLDVHTQFGRVVNQLAASDGPGSSAETAEVHARTSYGDIVIRRSVTA